MSQVQNQEAKVKLPFDKLVREGDQLEYPLPRQWKATAAAVEEDANKAAATFNKKFHPEIRDGKIVVIVC